MKYLIIGLMLLIYGCSVDTGTSVTEEDIENMSCEPKTWDEYYYGCNYSSSSITYWSYSSSSVYQIKTQLEINKQFRISNFYLNTGGIKVVVSNNLNNTLYIDIDYNFKCAVADWQKTGTMYLGLSEYESEEHIISYSKMCNKENDYGILTITAMRPKYETAEKYLIWHGEYTYYSINYK